MVTTRRTSIVRVVCVQKRSKLWKTHDERTIIVGLRFLKNVDQTQTVRNTSSACRTFAASSLRTVYVFFDASSTCVHPTMIVRPLPMPCDRAAFGLRFFSDARSTCVHRTIVVRALRPPGVFYGSLPRLTAGRSNRAIKRSSCVFTAAKSAACAAISAHNARPSYVHRTFFLRSLRTRRSGRKSIVRLQKTQDLI